MMTRRTKYQTETNKKGYGKRVRANLRVREMHMPTCEGSCNDLRLPSMAVCNLSWWCWKQLNK
jgi:hypothetical protein